jgi:hypothetical protein
MTERQLGYPVFDADHVSGSGLCAEDIRKIMGGNMLELIGVESKVQVKGAQ